jgi:hypothetical protein
MRTRIALTFTLIYAGRDRKTMKTWIDVMGSQLLQTLCSAEASGCWCILYLMRWVFGACIEDTIGSRQVGGRLRVAVCHGLQHRVLHLLFASSSSSLLHTILNMDWLRYAWLMWTQYFSNRFPFSRNKNCNVACGYANCHTSGAETAHSIPIYNPSWAS